MTIRTILFEQPFLLGFIFAIVAFVLVQVWRFRRTRWTARLAVASLVAIPVTQVLQAVVVTDAERLRSKCRSLADAVDRVDLAAIAEHISDDFSYPSRRGVWNKERLMERIKQGLTRWGVEEARVSGFQYQIDGDRATVSFRAICRLVGNRAIVSRHESRWRVTFRRLDEEWFVVGIQIVRTRWMPFDSLEDLLLW